MTGLFAGGLSGRDQPLGVAVSGGGDSVALLVLLHEAGVDLRAYTVDHGLRAEAADEAAGVAALCADLGVPHRILTWREKHGGNLQAAARAARYRLLAEAARADGIDTIALGHTLDDQAETFVMRLRRGSGVDGLSAMAPRVRRDGITWWRPLLDLRREELRAILVRRGITWVEDPSNDDTRFERVRVRKALAELEDIGLTPEALAETAARMARARRVLDAATVALAAEAAQARETGTVCLSSPAMLRAEAETRFRLLAHSLVWVSAADYRPRMSSLLAAWQTAVDGRATTLHGCRLVPSGDTVEIIREINAMPVSPAGGIYGGRWRTAPADGEVRPLGAEGLAQCEGWRGGADSRSALEATPALWQNGELRFAPLVRKQDAWQCRLLGGVESFVASITSH